MLGSLFTRAARAHTPIATSATPAARAWVLPLGLALGIFACSDEDPGTDMGAIVATMGGGGAAGGSISGGGTTGGTGGNASGGTTGSATAGGVTAGATTGGTTAGATGGSADASVADAGAGDASQGGAAVPEGGAAGLKTKCEGGEMMGCSSFITPGKVELQLGPYGAALDVNVGAGFETKVNASDTYENCKSFAEIFAQSPEENEKLLNLMGLDLKLYSVYRPASWKSGEKYPLLTWGNGTCAQPEGYGSLLRFIASHGFVVVAANSRYVGSNDAMKLALDFMFKANDDPASPYYQKLDTSKVGAMGHSQGSMATAAVASDARVKAIILYNGGSTSAKPFFAISGDMDLGSSMPTYRSNVMSASSKAAFMFFHKIASTGILDLTSGHLTLMLQPERLTDASVAWWKLVLNGDAASKEYFVGGTCKLCGKTADFDFGQKGLE